MTISFNKEKTNRFVQGVLITLILSASAIRMYNSYVLEMDIIYSLLRIALIAFGLTLVLMNNFKLIKPLTVVVLIMGTVFLHYLIFTDNRPYIISTFSENWIYAVVLFITVYIVSYEVLEKSMIVSAAIILFMDILLILSPLYVRLFTDYGYGGVGAVYSYSLLFPAVVFLYCFNKWKKWYLLIPSLAAFYLIVVYGSNRMSMICYILYVFYVFFFSKKGLSVKKIITTLILMIGAIAIAINLKGIVGWIIQISGISDYSPRILKLLSSDTFLYTSGRDDIFSVLASKVLSGEGVLGYGINGDRVLTHSHEYAHNIFMELLIEFGIVIGLFIIVMIVYMTVKAVNKRTRFNSILPVLFCTHIIALFVSGTFWTSNFFWMYISICLSILFPATLETSKRKEIVENGIV